MRTLFGLAAALLAACNGGGGSSAMPDSAAPAADAAPSADATAATDGVSVDASAGFGALSGMCGVLTVADLTGATPELFRDKLMFDHAYVDADDRAQLTPGGQRMMATPNAGGSSGVSEAFAFEELARCEHADLDATETEIVYDGPGKITDLEVTLQGHKIGVSVTRAVAFPFGDPYTVADASSLIGRKLTEIQASSAHVDPVDKWDKQILAVLAWDDAAADSVATAWAALDATVKADSLVVITVTDGDDTFIYSNQAAR